MSIYPHNLTPEGAPTDDTGSWPAVAGYAPMGTGRRVAIALVDGLIGGAVGGLVAVLVLTETTGGRVAGITIAVLFGLASLWAVFGRSARLAGLLMKAQYVDVRTGGLRGGSLFLKQLLQGVLAGATLGIAPLVLVFASVRGPMRRNFFDRATHLMLVDGRRGRRPGSPWVPQASTQGFAPVATVEFHPEQAPTAWGGATAAQSPPPVHTLTDDGGLITAVPGRGVAPTPASVPPAPAVSVPAVSAPPVPVAEGRPWAPPHEQAPLPVTVPPAPDHTILAPNALDAPAGGTTTPEVTLDGNQPLVVGPPLVVGRNPVAPGSHPDAVALPLEDALLSKTHLLLGRDADGVWVIDLNSTNGSRVATVPDAPARTVEPGRKVRLPDGSSVHFGQHRITVG